jgi:hypothetical protein
MSITRKETLEQWSARDGKARQRDLEMPMRNGEKKLSGEHRTPHFMRRKWRVDKC